MLIYKRRFFDGDEYEEITYEEALKIMLGTWQDNDMTRDMLTIPNRIQCMYSEITVSETDEWGERVLMAGMYNMLPMNMEYDDNGNHVNS